VWTAGELCECWPWSETPPLAVEAFNDLLKKYGKRRSRNTDVEGMRMIHALEAVGVAWVMINRAIECLRQGRLSLDLREAPASPKSRRPDDLACQEGERPWRCPW
jgi:hypothetical protein